MAQRDTMRELSNAACIVGVAESDEMGILPHKSQMALHLEAITNAVSDAGLKVGDVDGIFTAGAHSPALLGEALGVRPRYVDGTSVGGCSFMLLVEQEETDDMGHDNDIKRVVAGAAELDAAIKLVLELTEQDPEILVLITADHDTGGLGLTRSRSSMAMANVRWASDEHTSTWVPNSMSANQAAARSRSMRPSPS